METHVFHSRELSSTRTWAIDSDGVARLVEISSVVKEVLLAKCFLVFAFCLVRYRAIQGEISLFLTMILCHLAPTTRYSSQFTFQEFFLKAVFGFTQALWRFSAEPKWYLLLCWTLLWFKRHFLGILQSVDLLNMSRLKHWLTPILRYGCLQYYLNASVNSSCARPPRAAAGHLPALPVPGVGYLQILRRLRAGHLPTPGPTPSFWHARGFLLV